MSLAPGGILQIGSAIWLYYNYDYEWESVIILFHFLYIAMDNVNHSTSSLFLPSGNGGLNVVIIGGGFGGLRLARKLSKNKNFDITLIDRFNFHQFQPLFYQVATAGLDASSISFSLRKVFHKEKNCHFRMAEVKSIDVVQKKVISNEEIFSYDILVLANGADTNFFGNEELQSHAYPMKSTVEALQIKYKLLKNIEDALYAKDEKQLQSLMTIVIVGGGPTGVEMSGAIADMRRFVFPKDYPELDFSKMKIYLLAQKKWAQLSMRNYKNA